MVAMNQKKMRTGEKQKALHDVIITSDIARSATHLSDMFLLDCNYMSYNEVSQKLQPVVHT